MPGQGASYNSTISSVAYVANYLFSSNAVFTRAGPRSSSLANKVVLLVDYPYNKLTFQDPIDKMFNTIREMAFCTAVRAGKDDPVSTSRYNSSVIINTEAEQEVEYNGYVRRSIFVTDFQYMFVVAIISLSSIGAVALTFYGWWELGRQVSLSPLEIATAFDAPLLKPVGSNMGLHHSKALGPAGMQPV
jgi:hypothetical protein